MSETGPPVANVRELLAKAAQQRPAPASSRSAHRPTTRSARAIRVTDRREEPDPGHALPLRHDESFHNRRGRDDAKVAATKSAALLGLPLFVVNETPGSRNNVTRGTITGWVDELSVFQISLDGALPAPMEPKEPAVPAALKAAGPPGATYREANERSGHRLGRREIEWTGAHDRRGIRPAHAPARRSSILAGVGDPWRRGPSRGRRAGGVRDGVAPPLAPCGRR
jgi:hypothetical protein